MPHPPQAKRGSHAPLIVGLLWALLLLLPPCALAQPRPRPSSQPPAVSPKPAWGDFEIVEEPAPRPLFDRILLWFPNRVLDALDVFRLDVGVGPSFGGVVRASKYVQAGYRSMSPASVRVGLFGRKAPAMIEHSSEFGVSPMYVDSSDRTVCKGEIGLGADLFLVGGYAGICVDELVDFVGGVFTLDMKDDDLR